MMIAALTLGGLGLIAAVGLGVAAKVFYVEVDPTVEKVEEALPGANCGGCGQAGCAAAAVAIAQGRMPPNGCVASSSEVHSQIASILGVEVRETEPMVARVGCRYPREISDRKFEYAGAADCRAAFLIAGGPKQCRVGCLGFGSCARACPFGALSIGPNGLPVVDEAACTGCGTCVKTCPAGIMKLTSVTDRILREYQPTDCTAPCQRRCPAGIDMPEQIWQTAAGNYEAALRTIMERNPLPLICGRICPNPCELECRRNLTDEPVAINPLKRFVADFYRKKQIRPRSYKAPSTGLKVAVIGGGVEGLSAAYFLARLGHAPIIYEAADELGGLLRTAIPESRLPRDVLDWEIENILDVGVEAHTGTVFGQDIDLTSLFNDGYDAVLIAVGGWDALLTRDQRPDPALSGLYLLMPLIMSWARGSDLQLSGRAAVVGGGAEQVGTARQLLDRGADAVTIVWGGTEAEIGLSEDEAKAAADLGIDLEYRATVEGLLGQGDRVTGLSARVDGVSQVIETDQVIVASGRIPDMIVTPLNSDEADEPRWQAIRPRGGLGLAIALFETIEPLSDHRAAVEAIGAARRAAAEVHRLVLGLPPIEPDGPQLLPPPNNRVNRLVDLREARPRASMPEVDEEERYDPQTEVALGLSEEAALMEAERCLNCGLICYQRRHVA